MPAQPGTTHKYPQKRGNWVFATQLENQVTTPRRLRFQNCRPGSWDTASLALRVPSRSDLPSPGAPSLRSVHTDTRPWNRGDGATSGCLSAELSSLPSVSPSDPHTDTERTACGTLRSDGVPAARKRGTQTPPPNGASGPPPASQAPPESPATRPFLRPPRSPHPRPARYRRGPDPKPVSRPRRRRKTGLPGRPPDGLRRCP